MAGDMILDNIEEFVFDEDRVVSYKWLSRSLSLHVNHAKRKLEEFTEHWRTKEPSKPITVTFFVSGIQETTSGNELTKVAIVREDDLEKAKKRLKKTYCQHIYSVQKSALKDTGTLYQTDYDETKKKIYECNKFSAISCEAAQPRAPDELAAETNQRFTNGYVEPAEKKLEGRSQAHGTKKSKPKGLAAFMNKPKAEPKVKTEAKEDTKPENKETLSTAKQATNKHSKGSLMHAFASSKKTTKPSTNESVDSPPPPETTESKETKNQSDREEEDTSSSTKEDKKSPKEISKKRKLSNETEAPAKETKAPATDSKASARNAAGKKKADKPATKKASKRGISKLDTDSKRKQPNASKRRRVIQEVSSSESEEEEEDVEMMMAEEQDEEPDDTPIPPTPEPRSQVARESTKDTPTGKKGRRKVWKKVRYVDEDGCMVTDKVFESESEGESDGETGSSKDKNPVPEAKKEDSPPSPKKSSPPSAGRKQSALTSFFKKR